MSVVLTETEWVKAVESEPHLPASFEALHCLAQHLALREDPTPPNSCICATSERWLLEVGLSNPHLKDSDRTSIRRIAGGPREPEAYKNLKTLHFTLFYDTDDISESRVRDIGRHLENQRTVYVGDFKLDEKTFKGISVFISDVQASYCSSPSKTYPLGRMILAISMFTNGGELARQCTLTHELLHLVQFTFGILPRKDDWLTEGSATWAETYYQQGVHSPTSLNSIFEKWITSHSTLTDLSYEALPFWIFFNSWLQQSGQPLPLYRVFKEFTSYSSYPAADAVNAAIISMSPEHDLAYAMVLFAAKLADGTWWRGVDVPDPDPIRDSSVNPPVELGWPVLALPESQDLSIARTDMAWVGEFPGARLGFTVFKVEVEGTQGGDQIYLSVDSDSLGPNRNVGILVDGGSAELFQVSGIKVWHRGADKAYYIAFGGLKDLASKFDFFFGSQSQTSNRPFTATGARTKKGSLTGGRCTVHGGVLLVERDGPKPPDKVVIATPMNLLARGEIIPNVDWVKAGPWDGVGFDYAVFVYGGGPEGIGFTRLEFTDEENEPFTLRLRARDPSEHYSRYNSERPSIKSVTWS